MISIRTSSNFKLQTSVLFTSSMDDRIFHRRSPIEDLPCRAWFLQIFKGCIKFTAVVAKDSISILLSGISALSETTMRHNFLLNLMHGYSNFEFTFLVGKLQFQHSNHDGSVKFNVNMPHRSQHLHQSPKTPFPSALKLISYLPGL